MGLFKKPLARILAVILTIMVIGLLVSHFNKPALPAKLAKAVDIDAPVLAPEDEVHAKYAGSESCRECHASAFGTWQHSNHGLAEREINKKEDYKSFSPKQSLKHAKETSELFVDADGLAKILTVGFDKKRQAYQPVRVIGNNPLRQFLIPAPGGRMQTCDLSLDPTKNEWFSVFGDEERQPGDWGHWTGQGMNWNAMCAACHNTRVRKNYEPQTNSYHTTMAEMSVSCESCHGPMKDHVDWQKNSPKDTKADPTLHKFTRDQITETCAACHARRAELTGDMIPGEPFDDHFSLTVADQSDLFYPDGQVRDEDYEYTAFVSSKMYHAGVRCADCHDPHTNKPIALGNQLCLNCHAGGRTEFPTAPVIDPTAHSHHGADSAGNQCISCHMPVTTYMQRHGRHDHGFTIPDPKLTRDFNVPNACNRCHTDKDTAWAITANKQFFGDKPDRSTRTRALLIASAREGNPAARDGLINLLTTEQIPAWKATACHLLERWVADAPVVKALTGQLADESPLVREAAVRALGIAVRNNDSSVADSLKPMLDDSSRSVRIAAAWALCATLDLNCRAGRELVHMLDLNADQPTGRMQLGQFAMLRGNTAAAIRQIRKAIQWDPNSPPFHHDLAIMLSTSGDTQGATEELRRAIALDPENPEYEFKLALSLNEAGDLPGTINALQKTVRLAPTYARAYYNLGLALNSSNRPQEAIQALHQGELADPNDATIPYARATIHAQLKQYQEAQAAAIQAIQIRRDYPEAIQLLQALPRR